MSKTVSERFGQNLKRIRTESGLTQSDVAAMLNISLRAYQHYEAGTREPSLATLEALSYRLNTTIDSMIQTFAEDPSDE